MEVQARGHSRGIRRTVFLMITATFVNLALVSFASYGAVDDTESQTSCGQACHTSGRSASCATPLSSRGPARYGERI